jgi:hypothetical protein
MSWRQSVAFGSWEMNDCNAALVLSEATTRSKSKVASPARETTTSTNGVSAASTINTTTTAAARALPCKRSASFSLSGRASCANQAASSSGSHNGSRAFSAMTAVAATAMASATWPCKRNGADLVTPGLLIRTDMTSCGHKACRTRRRGILQQKPRARGATLRSGQNGDT